MVFAFMTRIYKIMYYGLRCQEAAPDFYGCGAILVRIRMKSSQSRKRDNSPQKNVDAFCTSYAMENRRIDSGRESCTAVFLEQFSIEKWLMPLLWNVRTVH